MSSSSWIITVKFMFFPSTCRGEKDVVWWKEWTESENRRKEWRQWGRRAVSPLKGHCMRYNSSVWFCLTVPSPLPTKSSSPCSSCFSCAWIYDIKSLFTWYMLIVWQNSSKQCVYCSFLELQLSDVAFFDSDTIMTSTDAEMDVRCSVFAQLPMETHGNKMQQVQFTKS